MRALVQRAPIAAAARRISSGAALSAASFARCRHTISPPGAITAAAPSCAGLPTVRVWIARFFNVLIAPFATTDGPSRSVTPPTLAPMAL